MTASKKVRIRVDWAIDPFTQDRIIFDADTGAIYGTYPVWCLSHVFYSDLRLFESFNH